MLRAQCLPLKCLRLRTNRTTCRASTNAVEAPPRRWRGLGGMHRIFELARRAAACRLPPAASAVDRRLPPNLPPSSGLPAPAGPSKFGPHAGPAAPPRACRSILSAQHEALHRATHAHQGAAILPPPLLVATCRPLIPLAACHHAPLIKFHGLPLPCSAARETFTNTHSTLSQLQSAAGGGRRPRLVSAPPRRCCSLITQCWR